MANFCGKCGKPIELCTCSSSSVDHGTSSGYVSGGGRYTLDARAAEMALGDGERRVREYRLGSYPFGCGDVRLLITNKRVILREAYNLLFFSHDRTEELNLESVHGVSGVIGRGMNKRWFLMGLLILFIPLVLLLFLSSTSRHFVENSTALFVILLLTALAGLALMVLSFIFPYVTFGIIGMGSDHQSLATGINVIGKSTLSSNALFQPRPTEDARRSLTEAGACIFDLRTYGDEAMRKWSK